MNSRRGFVLGAVCLAGGAAGFDLKPHRRTNLLGQSRLADVVPLAFDGWVGRDVGDLVAPATAGTLMSELYSQTVERSYQYGGSDAEVMMLLAYGPTQTNALQLHRPEVCYPAFGFRLLSSSVTNLDLHLKQPVPARKIVAENSDHRENIIYWTRLGNYLPASGSQQRLDRLKLAISGVVADGVLARFSMNGADEEGAFNLLRRFMPQLVGAITPDKRTILFGQVVA
jgi:EpsI family protein